MNDNLSIYPKSTIDYLRILNYLSVTTNQMYVEYNKYIRGERQINKEDVSELINNIFNNITKIEKEEF